MCNMQIFFQHMYIDSQLLDVVLRVASNSRSNIEYLKKLKGEYVLSLLKMSGFNRRP